MYQVAGEVRVNSRDAIHRRSRRSVPSTRARIDRVSPKSAKAPPPSITVFFYPRSGRPRLGPLTHHLPPASHDHLTDLLRGDPEGRRRRRFRRAPLRCVHTPRAGASRRFDTIFRYLFRLGSRHAREGKKKRKTTFRLCARFFTRSLRSLTRTQSPPPARPRLPCTLPRLTRRARRRLTRGWSSRVTPSTRRVGAYTFSATNGARTHRGGARIARRASGCEPRATFV